MKALQKYTKVNQENLSRTNRINGEKAANTEACVFTLMKKIEDAASKGEWHIEIKDDLILDKENGVDAKTFYDYMAPEVKKAFKKEGISFDHLYHSGVIHVSWYKTSFMNVVDDIVSALPVIFGSLLLVIIFLFYYKLLK